MFNPIRPQSKSVQRLSPTFVQKAGPGMHHDGAGLYLHVGPTGGKSWCFRYQMDGRPRVMGLGPYPAITLARAREKALEGHRLKAEGADPLQARDAKRKAAKAAATAAAITFRICAEKYIAAHEAGWKNPVHARQWPQTLRDYVYPLIGDLPVSAVETGHVTEILQPIWTTKTETAKRLRGRIEKILDFARTHGWRDGENPARWKGHLENVLPRPGKVAKVEHHASLAWREIGTFMEDLARQDGIGALALRFAILTGSRTSEAIGAKWSEIDMREKVWIVPAERMKAEREHRVPLSDAALEVLRALLPLRDPDRGDWVFAGGRTGKPLSNMAMLTTLRRMGRGDLTAHGFRSTFRTWCGETGKPEDLAEVALAHTQGKLHDAYQRGDKLERRRRLMEQWAEWCRRLPAYEADNVAEMRRAG